MISGDKTSELLFPAPEEGLVRHFFRFYNWNHIIILLNCCFVEIYELVLKGSGVRCVRRKFLLECLAKALPSGTIKFSSKVVAIEESGLLKLVHLVDGTSIKTKVNCASSLLLFLRYDLSSVLIWFISILLDLIEKVLIGCDGVKSVVAKWLGFKAPAFTGRCAVRGCLQLDSNHYFERKMSQYAGEGVRAGIIPCDDKTLYWFFTWTPSAEGEFTMVKIT